MANKETQSCAFKTSIGGQALLEGILMRGPEKQSIVCRLPDGTLKSKVEDIKPVPKTPFLRGIVILISSLYNGMNALSYSASLQPEESQDEPSKFDKWLERRFGTEAAEKAVIAIAMVLGVALAVGLFVLLPAFLFELLQLDHGPISRAGTLQGFMAADGLDAAVLDQNDFIHLFDGGDPVRDQDGGLAGTGLFQVVEDDALRLGVHGGNGVVQDQDRRVLHECAGNRDALLLAAGNGHAAFAEHRFVAVGEFLDVAVNVCEHRGFFHGIGLGVIHREGDVVGDRVAEQEVVLRDVGRRRTDVADRHAVDVVPVNEDRAVRHVVGAEDKVNDRGLAGTGAADEADVFTRVDPSRPAARQAVRQCASGMPCRGLTCRSVRRSP